MNLLNDIGKIFLAILGFSLAIIDCFWTGLKYYFHRLGELHDTFTTNVTHNGVLSVVLYIVAIVLFIIIYNRMIDSADKNIRWNNATKKDKQRAKKEKKAQKPSYMDYKNDKSTVSADEIERRRKIAAQMEAELAETKRKFAESQKNNQ